MILYYVYCSFCSLYSIMGLGGDFKIKGVAGGGVLINCGVHILDIVMYCCGDLKAKTVSAGNPMDGYVYTDMWTGPPKLDGVRDVEEGMVRIEGPVITFNGALAQNIDENEMFINFISTKAGIRLQYGSDFELYSTQRYAYTDFI